MAHRVGIPAFRVVAVVAAAVAAPPAGVALAQAPVDGAMRPLSRPLAPAPGEAFRLLAEPIDPWSNRGVPDHAPPESIAPYVDLLNEDDFTARLSAADFIYSTPSVTLDTLIPYLIRADLPPETRSRLASIADVLFRVTSRAAMGVEFERQAVAPVIIRRTVANSAFFRAHEVLEAGDEVLEADGLPVRDYDEFQAAILSRDPYEAMDLVIRRAGRVMDVRVPLGDYMRLGNPMLPADAVLRMAWERRLERILVRAPSPLTPVLDLRSDPGVRPDPAPAMQPEGNGQGDRGAEPRWRPAALVAGGAARGGVDQSGRALDAAQIDSDALAVEVRDYLRSRGVPNDAILEHQRQIQPLLERHRRLLEIRQRYADELAAFHTRLADPTLDQGQRRVLNESVARIQQTLADTQAQIDAITMMLPLGR